MNQQPQHSAQQEPHFCKYCKRQTPHEVFFNIEEIRYLICTNCRSTLKAA